MKAVLRTFVRWIQKFIYVQDFQAKLVADFTIESRKGSEKGSRTLMADELLIVTTKKNQTLLNKRNNERLQQLTSQNN